MQSGSLSQLSAPGQQIGLAKKKTAASRMHPKIKSRPTCQATQAPSMPNREGNMILDGAIQALFQFPPFFDFVADAARKKILKRGEDIGANFTEQMRSMQGVDWEAEMARIADKDIAMPDYYVKPFHAYKDGNLNMNAALETDAAAKSVHATVMDPAGKELDPRGDQHLRSNFSACTLKLMDRAGFQAAGVRDIIDLGCATGLSSLELLRVFPAASVTGVDLSPHMLAVGGYLQRQRQAAAGGAPERLTFRHGLAESTGLPEGSADLVSMCLVFHELPQAASREIMREAFRILKPGGAMAIMEMNPASTVFQRVFNNAFAYAAFKSTEPWLMEYISMDMKQELMNAGFETVIQLENSPRHKTVLALKP